MEGNIENHGDALQIDRALSERMALALASMFGGAQSGRLEPALASMFGGAQPGRLAPFLVQNNEEDNILNQFFVQQGNVRPQTQIPATEEMLNRLIETTVTHDHIDSAEQCCICISEFMLDEKAHVFPICKHTFHMHCIREWLSTNGNCPICRQVLSS